MKCSIVLFLFVNISIIEMFRVIDHSNEPYVLIPIEQAFLARENGSLFHVFNVTEIEDKFAQYQNLYHQQEERDKKIDLMIQQCKNYLEQLTTYRSKRSLNFLGTAIKWITGNPDHDDMILIEKKLNELIENNNQLSMINTALKKNLEHLTGGEEARLEILFEWLIKELKQIIDTINLAKSGILNTAALNLEEINAIIKNEMKTKAPLMEILEHSSFKIFSMDNVYIILIKYPIIDQKCMLYCVKPNELSEGKLQLQKYAVKCKGHYTTVRNCKRYIDTNICEYEEHTCTQELLNGFKTNCNMIREHMPAIEEIDDGKILIHGDHTVNNETYSGTNLILFNDSVIINNKNYSNYRVLIREYLHKSRPSQFEILNMIESENAELKIRQMSVIGKIPIEIENNPVRSTIIIIVFILLSIITIHFIIKICGIYNSYRLRKSNEKANNRARTLFNAKLGTISFESGSS